MKPEQRSPEEIEHLAQSEGLVTAAATLCPADRENEVLIGAIVAGVSRRNALISSRDEEVLEDLSGIRFFGVQTILCEVIPKLDVSPTEIMGLVRRLVKKGGADLATDRPNAAFRQWCTVDPARADAVIAAARGGDADTLYHLVSALEAKGDLDEAFKSARADSPERRAGILALLRLPLDVDQAQRAMTLILEFADDAPPDEAAKLIHDALDVAAKHNDIDRAGLADALKRLSASTNPAVVYLLATALHWHLPRMTPTEYDACLHGILAAAPENAGTIQQIDGALRQMWAVRPEDAARTASRLISRTEGRVAETELQGFFHAAKTGDPRALARLATSWLLEADRHACEVLSALFSEINRTESCIEISPGDLPNESDAQIFLCRKAVGFLFLSPMTAASWIVAVLRGGHADAAERAEGLLFEPLLVNYGGALYDWLERVSEEDAPGRDAIRGALDRARFLRNDIEAVADVVELEPSTHRRAQVQFMEAEEAERVQERAYARSIFAEIVTTQNLLYGDRCSFHVTGTEGRRHSQTTHMAELSVRSELPKGLVFDPVGLEHMLEVLRCEGRAEA